MTTTYDQAAILDLVLFSLKNNRQEAVDHFDLFDPTRIDALYRCPETQRRQLADFLLGSQGADLDGRHNPFPHRRARRSSGYVASPWQEVAIRHLEDS